MTYTTGDKGGSMDIMEPGWWAMGIAALGGFVGWRVVTAKDNVRIELMAREQEAIKERLRTLEVGTTSTATALATLAAQFENIGRTLERLETKLDEKADKR
jgi:hypothetical protein